MNLDEAVRLSPIGHAINLTLIADRQKWGYQDNRVPIVIVGLDPEESRNDIGVRVLKAILERWIEFPEIPDEVGLVPCKPDDLTPGERDHPDWEPLVTTDPVLNAAHLSRIG